jgi:YVTN family beta-propeller protein
VLVAPDGNSCIVASLRSRRLTFVGVSRPEEDGRPVLAVTRAIDLPFSPRNMALVREGTRLVVADAYGGRLALVDPGRGVLESVRSLPAHNIRGLATSPDGRSLVVVHQVLHRLARTSFEDVHWGSLLSNDLRALKLDRVLADEPDADPLRDGRQIDLGEPGHGSGDPAAVAFAPDGHVIVALAGVDEILIGTDPGRLPIRTGVGRRPAALAIGPDGRTVYVANTLDDTLSVVDVASGHCRTTIPLGPGPVLSPAERGERLFFDARLSHDGWMSCHSCHTDGHSNGRSGDTLGDGGFGAPKRVPSLLGVGATGPWGWLGGFERLEDQVRQSIESTMQGPKPTEEQVSDLVAYLRTLAAPAPAAASPDGAAAGRGREVFRTRGCAECHAPPQYTTPQAYDVGLADEVGHRRFNPPSLRGVGRREPLLHDGRAATLEEVFRRHRHPGDAELSPGEVADLVAFLQTL